MSKDAAPTTYAHAATNPAAGRAEALAWLRHRLDWEDNLDRLRVEQLTIPPVPDGEVATPTSQAV